MDLKEALIAEIKVLMGISTIEDSFYDMVLSRLESLGYELKETDAFAISFAIQKTENHIKNSCNISIVPNALLNIMCDMVCGEFMLQLLSLGKLDDIQISQTLSSIKIGDTNVSYSTSGANDKIGLFTSLMNDLVHSKEGDLVCFRKMTW